MPRKAKSNKITTSKLISQLKKAGKLHVYTKSGYKIPLKIACPEIMVTKRKTAKRSKRLLYKNLSPTKTRSGRSYKRRGGSKHSVNQVKNNNSSNTKIKNTNTNTNNNNNNNNSKGSLLKDVERNLINRLENLGINSKSIGHI